MKKLLLLLVPVLMLACSKDYTEDINTINGRLDKLEQESIPSVNEQLKLLESAIATLEDVDKDLGQLIDDLENTSGTHTSEINSLKGQDNALDTRVKDLESAKKSLEDDVKSLESKATETLSQLQETNKSLSALSTTVSTLGTNLGNLDKKIDEAVTSLDNKIKSAVEQLNSKIADLESRLKAVVGKVSELLARIQSVSYIPEYTDGKVLVERMGQTSSGSFSFRISPKDCVPALANVWGSALSCEAVYTKTRAVSLTKLTVTEFEGDAENGIITVKFSGEGLSEEFFAGEQDASVALVISDGNSSVVSEYIPMVVPKEVVPNNEIWYTSSDGNIVTPFKTDVFGANIVSNTYENGKGVIVFDAPVTSIGNGAFYDCEKLTSITIPNSVTSIGQQAFHGCSSLTSLTIGNSVTSIGEQAFDNCSSLTSVTIPNSVTSIGKFAFSDCSSLTSVTIPDSVTSIGNFAFEYCSSLTSVHISDLSAWCRISFYRGDANPMYYGAKLYLNGNELTELVIPSDIIKIKDYTFYNCDGLTSVTIPDSVTSIGSYAFYYCSSLTSVYCKPTTPPTGASVMFYGNASGRKIYVPRNSVSAYKSAEYWKDYSSVITGYDF